MKKKWLSVLFAAVLVACGTVPVLAAARASAAPLTETSAPAHPKVLCVTGTGKSYAAPDVAYISVGLQTRAGTMAEGQRAIGELYRKVLEAARGSDGEISVSCDNVYGYPVCESGRTAYAFGRDIRIKTKQPAFAEKIAEACAEAGATRYSGIRYELENTAEAYAAALSAAAEDAAKKAAALGGGERLALEETCVYGTFSGGDNRIEVCATVHARYELG